MRLVIMTFLAFLLFVVQVPAQKNGKKAAAHTKKELASKHKSTNKSKAKSKSKKGNKGKGKKGRRNRGHGVAIVRMPDLPDDVIDRLNSMETIVENRFDARVATAVNFYIKHKTLSEKVLGRTSMYYPIFEQQLKAYGLPDDLKNLTIVESQLQPAAISRAGAGGLWQFMRGTGNLFGLRSDGVVDERADPYKSSEAAARYLKKLYDIYGSWELVLAAYNSGSARVASAMKRGRSTNYWAIQRFLPGETQNYVPRFIAATYLYHHYRDHQFKPQLPDLDLQLTTGVKVYTYLTFQQISTLTGIRPEIVKSLNPSYRAGYVPVDPNGQFIVLPRRIVPQFMEKLSQPDQPLVADIDQKAVNVDAPDLNPAISSDDQYYVKTIYRVEEGDQLNKLAEQFNCNPYNIQLWNELPSTEISKGQELVIYQPRLVPGRRVDATLKSAKPVLVASHQPAQQKTIPGSSMSVKSAPKTEYVYHQVGRNESLYDIAGQYPGVSVDDLMSLNDINVDKALPSGTRIKVRVR